MKPMLLTLVRRVFPGWSREERRRRFRQMRGLMRIAATHIPGEDARTEEQWMRMERAILQGVPVRIRPRRVSPTWRIAVPLGVAVTAAGVAIISLLPGSTPVPEHFATGHRERQMVTLADSTEVTLNHTSEMVVTMDRSLGERRLTFRGDGYFRVRKSAVPMIIATDLGTVTVVGTEFHLRVRDSTLRIAVTRGSVVLRVSRIGRDSTLAVTEGFMGECERTSFPGSLRPLPQGAYPPWLHGSLSVTQMTVGEVCEEIERSFDVRIEIASLRIRGQSITGVLRGQSAQTMLENLAHLVRARVRQDHDTFTLY